MYAALILSSLLFSIYIIVTGPVTADLFSQGVINAIAFATMGSGLGYARKLYKACIGDSYSFSASASWSTAQIGTLAYFILRPLFAVALAVLVIFIWRTSVDVTVDSAPNISVRFPYLAGVVGFFCGFLAGYAIDRLETLGRQHLRQYDVKEN